MIPFDPADLWEAGAAVVPATGNVPPGRASGVYIRRRKRFKRRGALIIAFLCLLLG